MATRQGGRLDEARVRESIDGRKLAAVHGPSDMPVWGERIEELGQGGAGHTRLRIDELIAYLRAIQAKP